MSDRFESDVMEDLFYDAAEGPSQMEYGEEFEEADAFEEGFEEFEEGFEEGFEGMEDGERHGVVDVVAHICIEDDADGFAREEGEREQGAGENAEDHSPIVTRIDAPGQPHRCRGSRSRPGSAPAAAPTIASSAKWPWRMRMYRTQVTVSTTKAPEYQPSQASRTVGLCSKESGKHGYESGSDSHQRAVAGRRGAASG